MNDYLEDVKILIVDDQDFIRSLLRQMLGVLGAQHIYDAIDGEEAWDKMSIQKPDLLIVDWEMKPMDGVTFTKMVRNNADSPNPYVPIIMMTGHSEMDHVAMARDAGIHEYVTKPVSPKALFSRITNVIEHPRKFVRSGSYFGPDRRRRVLHVEEERRADAGDVH
jgi:two-component system chemotaxis response regulator CheY